MNSSVLRGFYELSRDGWVGNHVVLRGARPTRDRDSVAEGWGREVIHILLLALYILAPNGETRGGFLSRYDQAPTDATIAYRQSKNEIPGVIDRFDGVITVYDCNRVGYEGLLRVGGGIYHVLVIDCANPTDGGQEWMRAHGILAEIGWYLHVEYPHLLGSWATLVYTEGAYETNKTTRRLMAQRPTTDTSLKDRNLIRDSGSIKIRYNNSESKKPFEVWYVQSCKCKGEARLGHFARLDQAEVHALLLIETMK